MKNFYLQKEIRSSAKCSLDVYRCVAELVVTGRISEFWAERFIVLSSNRKQQSSSHSHYHNYQQNRPRSVSHNQ
jgi:hypothetical protein